MRPFTISETPANDLEETVVFEDEQLDPDTSAPESERVTLTLEPVHRGERMDKILAGLLPMYSRARIQQWMIAGRVTLGGAPVAVRQIVYGDETVEVLTEATVSDGPYLPEDVPLQVAAEDDTLLVLDKPAGLVVHPGAGNWSGTVQNGLLYRWPFLQGVPRAGIVHRLDKETSGLMVVAKTVEAQFNLVRQLQERSVQRIYLALVWGKTRPDGRIDDAIARHPRDRLKMAVSRSATAKPAITRFVTMANGVLDDKAVSLVRCHLETGRTHQIRVHLQSIGHPLVGDQVYGKPHLAHLFPRQALHAIRLGLIHPRTRAEVSWTGDIAPDMTTLLQQTGIDSADIVARIGAL